MPNILLTPIGRRGYLAAQFRSALAGRGAVIGADMSDLATGLRSCDIAVALPSCDDPAYKDALLELLDDHKVTLVLPLHDREAHVLAGLIDTGMIPPNVVVGTLSGSAGEAAWDKARTVELADAMGIAYPETVASRSALDEIPSDFEAMIKPRYGSASTSVLRTWRSEPMFDAYLEHLEREGCAWVVQRRVKGTEFGLDVIGGIDRTYAGCLMREKLAMRAGETDRARITERDDLAVLARSLFDSTRHAGLIDLDVMLSDGCWYLLDVNPRFGGGYPLSQAAGADIPALLVAGLLGDDRVPEAFQVRLGAIVAKEDRSLIVG